MSERYKMKIIIEIEGYLDNFGEIAAEKVKEALQENGSPDTRATNPRYFDRIFRIADFQRCLANGKITVVKE